MFRSNDKNANHTSGVTTMLSLTATPRIGWKQTNERLIIVKFKATHKQITLTVIMYYAPTTFLY